MRRPTEPFTVAVRAFKEMTAATDDAAATRARVLASAARASRLPLTPGRVALPTLAGLLVVATASIAGTTLGQYWRHPATIAAEEGAPTLGATAHAEHHGIVLVPPETVPPASDGRAPAVSDTETAAYGRAHRAHFVEGEPGVALAAWDDYLRRYPHGVFEPEARFNRALCLVRLRRTADAERALRPFSEGRYGEYRRAEATTLIDWLPRSPPAP